VSGSQRAPGAGGWKPRARALPAVHVTKGASVPQPGTSLPRRSAAPRLCARAPAVKAARRARAPGGRLEQLCARVQSRLPHRPTAHSPAGPRCAARPAPVVEPRGARERVGRQPGEGASAGGAPQRRVVRRGAPAAARARDRAQVVRAQVAEHGGQHLLRQQLLDERELDLRALAGRQRRPGPPSCSGRHPRARDTSESQKLSGPRGGGARPAAAPGRARARTSVHCVLTLTSCVLLPERRRSPYRVSQGRRSAT